MSDHQRRLAILFIGAIVISFSPVLVKLVGHYKVAPVTIAFWRTLIGGATLTAIVKLTGRSLHMSKTPALWACITGLCFALDLTAWHSAILIIGAGMSTLIGNTHIFITAVVSHLVFREKLTRNYLIAAPVAFVGLSLLVGVFSETVSFTPRYMTGVLLSISTAAMYAFYMLGLKKATIHHSRPAPATIMVWICLSAAFFLLMGHFFDNRSIVPGDQRSFLLLLILGVVGQALAWWGIAWAMQKIAIHHTALILLLQPALSMVWGYVFFNEILETSQIAGAVITLTAIYAGSVISTKTSR